MSLNNSWAVAANPWAVAANTKCDVCNQDYINRTHICIESIKDEQVKNWVKVSIQNEDKKYSKKNLKNVYYQIINNVFNEIDIIAYIEKAVNNGYHKIALFGYINPGSSKPMEDAFEKLKYKIKIPNEIIYFQTGRKHMRFIIELPYPIKYQYNMLHVDSVSVNSIDSDLDPTIYCNSHFYREYDFQVYKRHIVNYDPWNIQKLFLIAFYKPNEDCHCSHLPMDMIKIIWNYYINE